MSAGIESGTMLSVSGEATVMLCMNDRITAEQAQTVKDRLAGYFPGLTFVILSGCSGVMAYDDLGGRVA